MEQHHTVGEVEDLATLSKLDDKILLQELQTRYFNNKIYTYVGDILVSINPYRDLGLYGKNESDKYRMSRRGEHPPHIFAVADHAYQAMMGFGGIKPQNQCVLISGESGAGKTESTKLIIQQLIYLSKGNSQLEQQIIQVNPLLEAFGNAQTLMNDNSSRFGRYIQLKFVSGTVVGSKISEYLLEKSRVVRQNEGEENFHIFYYIFAGLSPEEQNKYKIKDPGKYKYICDGANCVKTRLKNLQEQYEEVTNAMDMVGFTDEEQDEMIKVLSSVLNLGNIDMQQNENGEAVIPTGTSGPIKSVAELLGIQVKELYGVMTSSVTFTRGDEIKRNYTKAQAEDSRDAIAKSLYGRLFSWIVNKINSILHIQSHDENNIQEVGILDIFGFEHFKKNSFEQACINLANEQLQFFFNKHVFMLEQEEYKKEGIDWKEIKFVDNMPLLDLFLAKPIGLLSLLDEESQFPRGSDVSFVEKANSKFDHDPYYTKAPHSKSTTFTIAHYAGKVTYDAEGWLEKNRDTMPPGAMEMLQSAGNELLSFIFKDPELSRTGTLNMKTADKRRSTRKKAMRQAKEAKERKLTVGAQFTNSLKVLMERMTASQPVFIRCIKPNLQKKADDFKEKNVKDQLLYTGMLETTKIRREGFAVRPTFAEFVNKYKILARQPNMGPTQQNCMLILQKSKVTGWQMGKTKVFLKYYHTEQLAEQLEQMAKLVIHMQRVVRGFLGRCKVHKLQEVAAKEKAVMEQFLKDLAARSLDLSGKMDKALHNDRSIPKDYFKNNKEVPVQAPAPPVAPVASYLKPTERKAPPKTVTMDTGVGDDTIDDDEDLEPVKTKEQMFGPAGTRMASTRWFQQTQVDLVQSKTGHGFADWFHGIITRRDSEQLLGNKPAGCFLIRVSESRFGYTLSFRGSDRCRHYMIDQLPNGKFIIVGEPKVHRSIHDMVIYYQKRPLSNYPKPLSVPCGQVHGECDYADLMEGDGMVYHELGGSAQSEFTQFRPMSHNPVPHRKNNRPQSNISQHARQNPHSYTRQNSGGSSQSNSRHKTPHTSRQSNAPNTRQAVRKAVPLGQAAPVSHQSTSRQPATMPSYSAVNKERAPPLPPRTSGTEVYAGVDERGEYTELKEDDGVFGCHTDFRTRPTSTLSTSDNRKSMHSLHQSEDYTDTDYLENWVPTGQAKALYPKLNKELPDDLSDYDLACNPANKKNNSQPQRHDGDSDEYELEPSAPHEEVLYEIDDVDGSLGQILNGLSEEERLLNGLSREELLLNQLSDEDLNRNYHLEQPVTRQSMASDDVFGCHDDIFGSHTDFHSSPGPSSPTPRSRPVPKPRKSIMLRQNSDTPAVPERTSRVHSSRLHLLRNPPSECNGGIPNKINNPPPLPAKRKNYDTPDTNGRRVPPPLPDRNYTGAPRLSKESLRKLKK